MKFVVEIIGLPKYRMATIPDLRLKTYLNSGIMKIFLNGRGKLLKIELAMSFLLGWGKEILVG